MDELNLFEQIIAELHKNLENNENFDQDLRDQIVALFRQPKFSQDELTKFIDVASRKDVVE